MGEGLKLNVLQRKMFKAGDVVTTGLDAETISLLEDFGVDNPSNLTADQLESEIIKIENELNNPALIGKGGLLFDYTNPLDYLAGLATLTGVGGIAAGSYKAAQAAAKGTKIANALAKLKKLKKSLSVIKGKKPGFTTPGVKGFQARPRFDPRSYQYDYGKLGLYGTSSGLILGLGGNQYESLPPEIQEALNELQEQKDEAEFDVETGSKVDDAESKKGIADSEIAKLQDLFLEAQTKASEDYKKQKKTFDKQNVFLEEVSDALAEGGGDIGYGLSTGAAKAAKRLSEEEAAAAEAEAELLQKQKEAEEKKNELKETTVMAVFETYGKRSDELETTKYLRNELKTLVNAVDPSQSDSAWTTDLRGWGMRFGDAFKGLIGADITLSKASTAKNIAKYLEANLVQQLLQESGRTISDRDRILIKEILGDLTKVVSNRADILQALRKVDAALARSARKQANDILALRSRYRDRIPELDIYDTKFDMDPIIGANTQNFEQDDVIVNKEDTIDVTEET